MAQTSSLDILMGAVGGALARVAARDDNPLTPDLVPAITEAVAADPSLQHATNSEPWYASRVTWGAIIAALAPVVGLALGRVVTAADQATLAEFVSAGGALVGSGLALYGRWVATRPIGAG